MTANSHGAAAGSGPTLMSNGDDQYGTYVDSAEAAWVVKFSRSTREITAGPYNLASISGNPLSLPLDSGDSHEAPSLGVDSQNRVWLAVNMFNYDPPRMVRSAAGSVTSWTNVSSQIPDATATPGAGGGHGYFNFVRFSDGGLMLLERERWDYTDGDQPGGDRCLYLAPGADTFTDRGYVTYGGRSTEDAFYRNNAYVDANDVVHLFGAWDQGFGPDVIVNGFSYLYSTDRGVSWKAMGGTALTTPINRTGASGVAMRTGISYDSDTLNTYGPGNCLDADGYPCGVYSKQGQGQRIVRWTGSAWTIDTTAGATFGGGQGLCLVNYRGDLWGIYRSGSLIRLRRQASPNENVAVGGRVTTQWYSWPDPTALMNDDVVEILVVDPTPRVYTFGDHLRCEAS